MSIVSEVKCPRCDRRYSGIRSRCPYCGARRMGRGKHSNSGENARGKIIIGLLLMGVLIVAVVVLLVSSLGDKKDDSGSVSTPPPTGESNVSIIDPTDTPPTDTTPPTDIVDDTTPPTGDTTPVEPVVQSVTITAYGAKQTDFTLDIGEVVPCKVKIVPEGLDVRVEWSSDKEGVFIVGPESGEVTGISKGDGTLTVTVGDVTATCIVRVSGKYFNG